tara:strand:+ start:2051 stop:2716 length:666 start_codon:yes stop_codon:yes gene_type:complete
MFAQTKKKIYIIGSNPKDFYDLTVESIRILSEVELIIIPKKFEKTFTNTFKDNHRNFIFEDDLAKKGGFYLWNKILDLFDKNQTIAHLCSGDSFLFNDGLRERDFFKSHNIEVVNILGIIEVVNCLNNQFDLLTNREKNSSITLFEKFQFKKISNLLKHNNFEKLIVKVQNKEDFEIILKLIKENEKKINLKIIKNGVLQKAKKNINIKSADDYIFLILEK